MLGAGVPLALPLPGVSLKLSSLPTGGAIDRVVAAVFTTVVDGTAEDSPAGVILPAVDANVVLSAAAAPPRPPRRPLGGAFGLTCNFGGMLV